MKRKQKLVRTEWLSITRRLLFNARLPQPNEDLFPHYDNGSTPLETLEFYQSRENRIMNETVRYADGTVATGPAPLPKYSPAGAAQEE